VKFKETKLIKRDKEGNYILIKGTIWQESIRNINVYALNFG
jgi:hypothetical protein